MDPLSPRVLEFSEAFSNTIGAAEETLVLPKKLLHAEVVTVKLM